MKERLRDNNERSAAVGPAHSYRIGILLGERSNPFWSHMEEQYRALAHKIGIQVTQRWPDPRQAPQSQLRALKAMLDLRFDAIVVNPMTRTNLVSGIKEAVDRGILILDVGAKTDPDAVRQAAPLYMPVRTVDFYEQGVLGGRYLVDKLKSMGGGKVAIIEGRENSAQSLGRSHGAFQAFCEDPSIHLVFREPADFHRGKARGLAQKIMSLEPELKAFFCANDTMALGVADALGQTKGESRVLVVGVDLIEETRQAILEGRVTASVFFSPAQVAEVVLGTAINLLGGGSQAGHGPVPSVVVDRTNLYLYLN